MTLIPMLRIEIRSATPEGLTETILEEPAKYGEKLANILRRKDVGTLVDNALERGYTITIARHIALIAALKGV